MKTARLVMLAMVLACFVLAGCGQKGPLFLPDKAPASPNDDDVFGMARDSPVGDDEAQPQFSPAPARDGSSRNEPASNADPDRPSTPVGTQGTSD